MIDDLTDMILPSRQHLLHGHGILGHYYFSPQEVDDAYRLLVGEMLDDPLLAPLVEFTEVFHANMPPEHREEVLADAKSGRIKILFGTVCMGLVGFRLFMLCMHLYLCRISCSRFFPLMRCRFPIIPFPLFKTTLHFRALIGFSRF